MSQLYPPDCVGGDTEPPNLWVAKNHQPLKQFSWAHPSHQTQTFRVLRIRVLARGKKWREVRKILQLINYS